MPAFNDKYFPHARQNLSKERTFRDHFLLPSNEAIPTDFNTLMDLCPFLFHLNDTYRMAALQLVAYFVTELDFKGKMGDDKERKAVDDTLNNKLKLLDFCRSMGGDHSCYGNAFGRIYWPFDRYLVDSRGGSLFTYAISQFNAEDVKFSLSRMEYEVPDPKTRNMPEKKRKRVWLPFRDIKSRDVNRIKLRRLDPRFVDLRDSWASGDYQVVYRFEPHLLADVKNGNIFQINRVPMSMLQAMRDDQDYEFDRDEIFHLKSDAVSGLTNGVWGVPEVLINYRSIHQLQVYRSIDEAVGLDHMQPFRFFSPDPSAQVGDALERLLGQDYTTMMQGVIDRRRVDPYAIFSLPVATTYHEFGGEGKELVGKDLLQYQTESMLNAMGYPAELYVGRMKLEQMPANLRLFESRYSFLHRGMNDLCQWVNTKVFRYLKREILDVYLKLPSVIDDIEEQFQLLQLASGQEVSRGRAYRGLDIEDPVDEIRKRLMEDIEIEKIRNKIQQDAEREMMIGSGDDLVEQEMQDDAEAEGGGAGSPAPGAPGFTPLNLMEVAEQEASKILSLGNVGEQNRILRQMQASNPDLHAATKQKMEEIRSQTKSQAVAQLPQQLAQGG